LQVGDARAPAVQDLAVQDAGQGAPAGAGGLLEAQEGPVHPDGADDEGTEQRAITRLVESHFEAVGRHPNPDSADNGTEDRPWSKPSSPSETSRSGTRSAWPSG